MLETRTVRLGGAILGDIITQFLRVLLGDLASQGKDVCLQGPKQAMAARGCPWLQYFPSCLSALERGMADPLCTIQGIQWLLHIE